MKAAVRYVTVVVTLPRQNTVRINEQIRVRELRVIGEDGENLGTLPIGDAIKKAEEAGLDLIEIASGTVPPVAKIMDYGKYQYDQKKKARKAKAKAHVVETKTIQIKPGTGDHDLSLKAKRISSWLKEGNRVKVELFLRGRSKYMEKDFLEARLKRVLDLVAEPYKTADGPKKGPKGMVVTLEKN